MASGPTPSWQIDGKTMETVRDFILGGSRITADSDCSHEIKTLTLWKKSYDQPRQHSKKQRHYQQRSIQSKLWFFQESCMDVTVGSQRKLSTEESMLFNCGVGEDLRFPWTARRSNQSILKEISPECSLKGLRLKLKHQYFSHLM